MPRVFVLKGRYIKNSNFSFMSNDILMPWWKINSMWTFVVSRVNCNLEVLKVFSLINSEARLPVLICNTISHSSTKHHYRAIKIIIHWIFKCWFKSILINHEKMNVEIGDNLNSYITSDEVNLSSHVLKFFIHFPFSSFMINLKELDVARWSCN